MPGTSAFLQYLGIDTFSIVANPKAKHVIIVPDFRLDSVCLCMAKSVSQDFDCDPTNLVLSGRRQSSPLALFDQVENWRILIRRARSRQFLTRGSEQIRDITVCNWLRTQPLNRTPAFGERLLGVTDRIVKRLHRFINAAGKQVTACLELEHQSMKSLQQGIV